MGDVGGAGAGAGRLVGAAAVLAACGAIEEPIVDTANNNGDSTQDAIAQRARKTTFTPVKTQKHDPHPHNNNIPPTILYDNNNETHGHSFGCANLCRTSGWDNRVVFLLNLC